MNRAGSPEEQPQEPQPPQPTVIPGADSLTGDLLDLNIGGPTMYQPPQPPVGSQSTGIMDLLGDGLDNLLGGTQPPADAGGSGLGTVAGLGDIFGFSASQAYVPPQEVCILKT